MLRSGDRHAARLVAGLEHRGVALDRLQTPRADRITGQQHLKLVGCEVPAVGATDTLRWPARSSAPTTRNGSGGGSAFEAAGLLGARVLGRALRHARRSGVS